MEVPKEQKLKSKYSLTEEETKNLGGRDYMLEYIVDLVKRDVGIYLTQVIYKRLGLPFNTKSTISEDRKSLEVDLTPDIITNVK
jgi:hypothetical protein